MRIDTDDRVLVIAGGLRNSCWGDILANAAMAKKIRGSIIDGVSRDIEGSESIAYPVYGRGITMISARTGSSDRPGQPVQIAGVTVREDDYVIADRCGTVFVPASQSKKCWSSAKELRPARTVWSPPFVRGARSPRSCTTKSSKQSALNNFRE